MNHPNAINLHGVQLKQSAGRAAWEYLAGFNYWRTRIPGMPGVLRDLQTLQDTIEDVRVEIVRDMRADGLSWGEVGDALGMTRQGARQRYGGRGIG